MYVVTADQVDSRTSPDIAGRTRDRINNDHRDGLLLPADRNAGDEIQTLTSDAATALTLVLELTREGRWSVGLGCGPVRLPLPAATREASGPAFFAARDAVARAKKEPTRFAAHTALDEDTDPSPAQDLEALIKLLLLLRARRTDAGWELYDLLAEGLSQLEASRRLGISPPATSSRAKAAGLRVEETATPALVKLVAELDRSSTGMEPS